VRGVLISSLKLPYISRSYGSCGVFKILVFKEIAGTEPPDQFGNDKVTLPYDLSSLATSCSPILFKLLVERKARNVEE
jgi:hypothetical protein